MSTIQRVELDSTQRCPDAVEFERRMHDRVIGQDEAIEKLSWMVQTFMAGFSPVGRPAGVPLFLRPTGIPHSERQETLVPSSSHSPRPPLPSTATRRTAKTMQADRKRNAHEVRSKVRILEKLFEEGPALRV